MELSGSTIARPVRDRAPAWRLLFWTACAWAVAAIWLAPHLPQVDLPQHAGQVALLREYALGRPPWPDELRLNLLTPYLVGYLPLLALSFVMSIESAIAVFYSVTFLAFVASCIALRKELAADERLDWLCIPVFFGLAWHWGFLTFLAAVPIGVFFLAAGVRYTDAPSWRRAGALLGLGAATLFGHGLVFLYAVPIGLAMALVTPGASRPVRWRLVLPYLVLLAVFALYKTTVLDRELTLAPYGDVIKWGEPRNRLRALLIHSTTGLLESFPVAPFITLLGFAAPWLLGLRPSRSWRARIPFLWTLGMMLAYPAYVSGATNFYDRFAMLLLPTYATMFAAAGPGTRARWRPAVVSGLLAIAAVLVIGRETVRNVAFAQESRGVDALLARIPPGQRLLYLPLEPESTGAFWRLAYFHYALWYQALHGGLVEFNFATLLPQVVRFHDFRRHIQPFASWEPERFMPWWRFERDGYAYVLVRSRTRPPAALLAGRACPLVQVDGAPDGWWLYRNLCAAARPRGH